MESRWLGERFPLCLMPRWLLILVIIVNECMIDSLANFKPYRWGWLCKVFLIFNTKHVLWLMRHGRVSFVLHCPVYGVNAFRTLRSAYRALLLFGVKGFGCFIIISQYFLSFIPSYLSHLDMSFHTCQNTLFRPQYKKEPHSHNWRVCD